MVEESGVAKSLLETMGVRTAIEVPLTTAGMLQNAVGKGLAAAMDEALVGLIIDAQKDAVEECWSIVVEQFDGIGAEEEMRRMLEEKFEGVELK